MTTRRHIAGRIATLTLLPVLALLLCGAAAGCAALSGSGGAWLRTEDVPMEVLAGARRASESITGPRRERPALPPQFFRSGAGNYRVVWFTMDPRRDTYWYEWYEFSPGGQIVRGGASPVPGRLPEPEVEHIPGW